MKTSHTQLLAVHMCGKLLKEGGVDWDGNVTRAPNQHMDTGEVKEGDLKAEAWEWSSSSQHTLQAPSICVFMSRGHKMSSNSHFTHNWNVITQVEGGNEG